MLAVRATTPPLPVKKAGFIDKISDTSLFAELVKDKHKRKKALKEIMKKTDDEGLNGNDSVDSRVIDLDTNSDSVENVNHLNSLSNLNCVTVCEDEDVMIVEEKRNFKILAKLTEAEGLKESADLQFITDIPMPEAEKDAEVKNGVFSSVSDSEKGECFTLI